jgi:tRNA A37 methylthiotransferase MiaB
MAKQLHVALQHTSDKMLQIMNRRNTYPSDLAMFHKIADKGYALGTDYIVGHPGEDDTEWKIAMDRVKELPITHVHAFSYSKRDNTVSATLKPEIRGNIAKERHRELTAIIKAKNYAFRREHTENLEVLLENGNNGIYHGFDQYFNKVEVQSTQDLSANWVLLNNVEVSHEGNKAKV